MLARSAFLFVLAATTLGAAGAPFIKQVVVDQRYTSVVCGGLCVNQRVVVSADGHVWWRISDPKFDRRSAPIRKRFLVSPRAAAAFIREMSAIKPDKSLTDGIGCDTEYHMPKLWDWDIQWSHESGAIRLRSCDGDRRILSAWQAAIKVLGMPQGFSGPYGNEVKELPAE